MRWWERGTRKKEERGHGEAVTAMPRDHEPDIHDLVRRLDVHVTDRSARDFAIMCALLRRGLLESEIYGLVIDRSKFGTNGDDYFRHTFDNAKRAVGG